MKRIIIGLVLFVLSIGMVEGLTSLGEELVTNGKFDTNTDWDTFATGLDEGWKHSTVDKLAVTFTGGEDFVCFNLTQNIDFNEGDTYQVYVDYYNDQGLPGDTKFIVWIGGNNFTVYKNEPGSPVPIFRQKTANIQAGDTDIIKLEGCGQNGFGFDTSVFVTEISVKEIITIDEYEFVAQVNKNGVPIDEWEVVIQANKVSWVIKMIDKLFKIKR